MKARLNTSRIIPFFDALSEIPPPPFEKFVVQVLDPLGAEVASLTMTEQAANLWFSAPFIPEMLGQYQLRFKYGNIPVVIHYDTLDVGVSPVSDFPFGEEVDLVLPDSIVGGPAQTVTAQLYDIAGSSLSSTSYALYVGDQSITTFPITDGDELEINVFPDPIPTGAQTVTFSCASAEVTGTLATYAAGLVGDIATYKIDGGTTRQIDLNGVAGNTAAYVALFNAQLKGAFVEDSVGELRLVTDSLGTDSVITLSNFQGNFADNTGLTEGIYGPPPGSSNVANGDAVTFLEVKLLIETGVSDVAPGDRILVTQEAVTNNLILTAVPGNTGILSQIDLVSGDASLLTSLGLTGLGTQGGNPEAIGSDGITVQAPYSADVDGYVVRELTFSNEQQVFVVWLNGGVPTHLTQYMIFKPVGLEVLYITVGDAETEPNIAHSGVIVTVSTLIGNQVIQGVTDGVGGLRLELPPGEFVFTLTSPTLVFSRNNFIFEVYNSRVESFVDDSLFSPPGQTDVQAVQLITKAFTPTITATPDPAPMCTLFATLYYMDGSPVRHAAVHVGLVHRPELFSGTAVFDTQRVFKTDSNGFIEFSLVQGIQVDISVAPLSLKRRIIVPSNAGPTNLMTLLSGADDPFDVLIPNIVAAPKRT
jgi:hypothetical protein